MNNNSDIAKVLVIDDLEINLKLLSEILEKNKITVTTCNSGKDAVKIANDFNPDLILLDIAMPEKDGFDVCSELKNSEKTKNIPVIFLTALNNTNDVVKGLKLGAVDYLTKPYKAQELITRINSHIDLKKAKDLINKQNEELKLNNLQLTKSLHYAKHIQDKLLPKESSFKKYFKDYFLVYMPKHIVSGDFYWLTNQSDLTFLAVIDYTGHGMPGALMSMIGNTLLNEIIIKNQIYDPGKILNELNEEIIKTLNIGNEFSDIDSEGMDISICAVDKKNKQIKVASANQDVCYIQNNEFKKIEGDIISIGRKFSKNETINFITHSIDISLPTYIYLCTDGYQDQFGGPENKKYQTINFEKILHKNHTLPFADQKQFLVEHFQKWKAEVEQTDDILVIGFKTDL